MSLQPCLPAPVVRVDPWMILCAECSQKMRIMMATPVQGGRETRTYECAYGHSERITVAIPEFRARQQDRRAQFAQKNFSPELS
jgi:hypothetical protein